MFDENPWFAKMVKKAPAPKAVLSWPSAFPDIDNDEVLPTQDENMRSLEETTQFTIDVWNAVGTDHREYQDMRAFVDVVRAGTERQAMVTTLRNKSAAAMIPKVFVKKANSFQSLLEAYEKAVARAAQPAGHLHAWLVLDREFAAQKFAGLFTQML